MKTKAVCNPIIYWKLNESTHSSGTSVFQPPAPPFLMMSAAILNLDWHSNQFKKRPNKLFKLQIVEKTDSGSVNDQTRSLITFDLTSKKQYFLKFVWGNLNQITHWDFYIQYIILFCNHVILSTNAGGVWLIKWLTYFSWL